MTPVGEQLLAHHAALLAIRALVPGVVVVGVVIYFARKDRRDVAEERDLIERAFEKDDDREDDA